MDLGKVLLKETTITNGRHSFATTFGHFLNEHRFQEMPIFLLQLWLVTFLAGLSANQELKILSSRLEINVENKRVSYTVASDYLPDKKILSYVFLFNITTRLQVSILLTINYRLP